MSSRRHARHVPIPNTVFGAPIALAAYAIALVVAAVAVGCALVATGHTLGPWPSVVALAILAYFAERQSVRLSASTQISVAFLPFVFAAVAFGPLAAMLVATAGLISEFNRPFLRWCVWSGSRALVAAGCGLAASSFGGLDGSSFSSLTLAVVAATVTEVVLDTGFASLTLWIRRTGSLRTVARESLPIVIAAVPLYTPVVAVLAFAYREISPWSVAFFLIPAFAAQRLFHLYR